MIRMVKTPFEIEKISEAGKIVSKVFENVPKIFKDGMSERDLLIELEYISKKEGNIGFYRMHSFGNEASFSHILQGESALISSYLDAPTGGPGISDAFPQGASLKKIEKNKPFTIDVMVNFDGYLADATRTFVWGKVDESAEKAWQRLYEIFFRVEADLTPGSIPENIYQKTLELAHSLGVEHIFMGPGKDKVKFIGHGLGLEVDEYPFIAKGFKIPLSVNSIVAIEPKFISDEFGILGLEDTFIITDNGPVSVINFPRDIFKL
ncbi:MAG: M24 family metallopeptidase, partial [candidate division WOR-3 bacterium]